MYRTELNIQDCYKRMGNPQATERDRQDCLRAMSFYLTEGQIDYDKITSEPSKVFDTAYDKVTRS